MMETFVSRHVPKGSDGQLVRAAQRFGLIAAAGELATMLEVTPWKTGEPTAAAALALGQWIMLRGGTEPAEVRQAIAQVRLFIEQHGESRFEDIDCSGPPIVINRAGWRTGKGQDREWWVPSQVWKEICSGLDPTGVAKTLAERDFLRRAKDGYQVIVKIAGKPTRVYALQADIIEGGHDEG
jgi:putative DNA primase/helicase